MKYGNKIMLIGSQVEPFGAAHRPLDLVLIYEPDRHLFNFVCIIDYCH